jgi:hypothetical protein
MQKAVVSEPNVGNGQSDRVTLQILTGVTVALEPALRLFHQTTCL